jgi:hypothetical protein
LFRKTWPYGPFLSKIFDPKGNIKQKNGPQKTKGKKIMWGLMTNRKFALAWCWIGCFCTACMATVGLAVWNGWWRTVNTVTASTFVVGNLSGKGYTFGVERDFYTGIYSGAIPRDNGIKVPIHETWNEMWYDYFKYKDVYKVTGEYFF